MKARKGRDVLESQKSRVRQEAIVSLKNDSKAVSHLERDLKCGSLRKNENESAKFEAMKINKGSPKLIATCDRACLIATCTF